MLPVGQHAENTALTKTKKNLFFFFFFWYALILDTPFRLDVITAASARLLLGIIIKRSYFLLHRTFITLIYARHSYLFSGTWKSVKACSCKEIVNKNDVEPWKFVPYTPVLNT